MTTVRVHSNKRDVGCMMTKETRGAWWRKRRGPYLFPQCRLVLSSSPSPSPSFPGHREDHIPVSFLPALQSQALSTLSTFWNKSNRVLLLKTCIIQNWFQEAREMAQWLRVLVLAENWLSTPSTTRRLTIICNASPRGSDTWFWTPRAPGTHKVLGYTSRLNTIDIICLILKRKLSPG